MKPAPWIVAVFACLSLVATASAEMVDNPDYAHWSSFGAGSSATLTGMTAMGQGDQKMQIESQRIIKLVSIDENQAVIEHSIVTKMPGMALPPMVHQETIPAKVEAGQEQDMLNPESKIEEGQETLEIDGKSYDTKWVSYKMTEQGVSMTAKSWYADDVPGRQVKLSAQGDGQMSFSSELELSAVEVK